MIRQRRLVRALLLLPHRSCILSTHFMGGASCDDLIFLLFVFKAVDFTFNQSCRSHSLACLFKVVIWFLSLNIGQRCFNYIIDSAFALNCKLLLILGQSLIPLRLTLVYLDIVPNWCNYQRLFMHLWASLPQPFCPPGDIHTSILDLVFVTSCTHVECDLNIGKFFDNNSWCYCLRRGLWYHLRLGLIGHCWVRGHQYVLVLARIDALLGFGLRWVLFKNFPDSFDWLMNPLFFIELASKFHRRRWCCKGHCWWTLTLTRGLPGKIMSRVIIFRLLLGWLVNLRNVWVLIQHGLVIRVLEMLVLLGQTWVVVVDHVWLGELLTRMVAVYLQVA